jgi:hypothetical protein
MIKSYSYDVNALLDVFSLDVALRYIPITTPCYLPTYLPSKKARQSKLAKKPA